MCVSTAPFDTLNFLSRHFTCSAHQGSSFFECSQRTGKVSCFCPVPFFKLAQYLLVLEKIHSQRISHRCFPCVDGQKCLTASAKPFPHKPSLPPLLLCSLISCHPEAEGAVKQLDPFEGRRWNSL